MVATSPFTFHSPPTYEGRLAGNIDHLSKWGGSLSTGDPIRYFPKRAVRYPASRR
jgi:hypothetical protein